MAHDARDAQAIGRGATHDQPGLGMIVVWLQLGVVTIWLVYRIARGWIRLAARQPMYAESR
jgi:uncharacterized membrane protein